MIQAFSRRTVNALLGAAPLLFLRGRSASAQISEMPPTITSEAEQIALDAYVYGYSLITTEVTRVQMSNVDKVVGMHAPTGQFANIKRYPPADFRLVSAPNADTLYSVAWLDLAEPQVFSHPEMGERFYLFEMTDLWMTDFDSPGTRTAGGKAANYLITGPGWAGAVPEGMKQIKAATRYIVILGRTYANGTDQDYEIVNALQAQYEIVPLSAYGKSDTYRMPPVNPNPGFSMTDKPQSVILDMDTSAYFNMMARLMGSAAPPAPEDAPMLARMAKIGLVPGHPFDLAKLEPATAGRAQGPRQGRPSAHRGQQEQFGRDGERLGRDQGSRSLRNRLHEAGRGGGLRLAGQPSAGCRLSVHRSGQRGPEAFGSEQIHAHLCKGRNAARRWVLVDHYV